MAGVWREQRPTAPPSPGQLPVHTSEPLFISAQSGPLGAPPELFSSVVAPPTLRLPASPVTDQSSQRGSCTLWKLVQQALTGSDGPPTLTRSPHHPVQRTCDSEPLIHLNVFGQGIKCNRFYTV